MQNTYRVGFHKKLDLFEDFYELKKIKLSKLIKVAGTERSALTIYPRVTPSSTPERCSPLVYTHVKTFSDFDILRIHKM
jgi:hypothetical protein